MTIEYNFAIPVPSSSSKTATIASPTLPNLASLQLHRRRLLFDACLPWYLRKTQLVYGDMDQSRHPPIIPAFLTLAPFPPPPVTVVPTASTSATPDVHRLATSTSTPALYNALSLLLRIIAHVPLSLPLLNDGVFFPESKPQPRSKNADEDVEDELYSVLLQLARSTVCLITDSNVTEGQINDRGVRNLRA
ncbi:hypothetical protein EV368DRAFT_83919 [Lentinula lateritia]|nr:hypothetical protein EV368DRAFT_83919 [Lentinula lateritia]